MAIEKHRNGKPANVGLTIIETLNTWAKDGLVRRQLETIARDQNSSFSTVIAAIQGLHASEYVDMADFQPLMSGREDMEDLRKHGVNTAAVRKWKVRERTTTDENGNVITDKVSEIELHERSLEASREIMDRTNGKAIQQMIVENTAPIQGIMINFMGVVNNGDASIDAGPQLPSNLAPQIPDNVHRGQPGNEQNNGTLRDVDGESDSTPRLPHPDSSESSV